MMNDKRSVPLPDDLLAEISKSFGKIASAETFAMIGLSIQMWTHLEKGVNACLALLIAQPPAESLPEAALRRLDNALIAVGGKDIKVSLGAMKTIVEFNYPDRSTEFGDLKDKIEKALLKKRNVFAHHIIVSEAKNGTVTFGEVKSIGSFKTINTPFTRAQLSRVPFEFITLHKMMIAFVESLGFHMPR